MRLERLLKCWLLFLFGVAITTYAYDEIYRLTGENVAGVADPGQNGTLGYTLDKVGNRSSRLSSLLAVQNQTNAFNARDWLSSDTYTPNGSTIQGGTGVSPVGSTTDAYDFEEHLILRTKTDGSSINVSYDADGNRIAKNLLSASASPVSSTSWLVDTNNLTGYAQVIEERVSNGGPSPSSVVRIFTYGSSLISQATSLNAQPSTLNYYTFDGHGSVRELTDATGAVTDRYDYDAYGVVVFKSGITANSYLYCSEQFDSDLNLYYNRARYLNTDSGRFWSADTYEGSPSDPISLHRYLYANANPVMFSDPSGEFTLTEAFATTVVVGTLAAIAIPSVQAYQKGSDGVDIMNAAVSGFLKHMNCLMKGSHYKTVADVTAPITAATVTAVSPYALWAKDVLKVNLPDWFRPLTRWGGDPAKWSRATSLLRAASVAAQKLWGSKDFIATGLREIANGMKAIRPLTAAARGQLLLRGTARMGIVGLLVVGVSRTGTCLGEQIGEAFYGDE